MIRCIAKRESTDTLDETNAEYRRIFSLAQAMTRIAQLSTKMGKSSGYKQTAKLGLSCILTYTAYDNLYGCCHICVRAKCRLE